MSHDALAYPLPEVGSWVRWVDIEVAREGEVIQSEWPSLVVQWLGVDEPQVFPLAYPLLHDKRTMEVIPRPARASQIRRDQARGRLGIAAAAARLGTTQKRVRQRLRDGQLKGKQVDGRWVEVYFD